MGDVVKVDMTDNRLQKSKPQIPSKAEQQTSSSMAEPRLSLKSKVGGEKPRESKQLAPVHQCSHKPKKVEQQMQQRTSEAAKWLDTSKPEQEGQPQVAELW